MIVKPLTKETWQDYISQPERDEGFLFGYIEAIDGIVPELEKILKTKKSYKELKEEILDFCNERKKFTKDVDKNWNYPTTYNLD